MQYYYLTLFEGSYYEGVEQLLCQSKPINLKTKLKI